MSATYSTTNAVGKAAEPSKRDGCRGHPGSRVVTEATGRYGARVKYRTHAGRGRSPACERRLAKAWVGLRMLLRLTDRGGWVAPGVLGCAYPRTERALAALSGRGVRLLVNLHVRPHNPARLERYGLREVHLPVKDFVAPPCINVSSRNRAISKAVKLEGRSRCWSRMFTSTAPTWTCASVSPGISVNPVQSMIASCPPIGPDSPRRTSVILSPSTTTDARSCGSFPAQSMRKTLMRSVVPATLRSPPLRRIYCPTATLLYRVTSRKFARVRRIAHEPWDRASPMVSCSGGTASAMRGRRTGSDGRRMVQEDFVASTLIRDVRVLDGRGLREGRRDVETAPSRPGAPPGSARWPARSGRVRIRCPLLPSRPRRRPWPPTPRVPDVPSPIDPRQNPPRARQSPPVRSSLAPNLA